MNESSPLVIHGGDQDVNPEGGVIEGEYRVIEKVSGEKKESSLIGLATRIKSIIKRMYENITREKEEDFLDTFGQNTPIEEEYTNLTKEEKGEEGKEVALQRSFQNTGNYADKSWLSEEDGSHGYSMRKISLITAGVIIAVVSAVDKTDPTETAIQKTPEYVDFNHECQKRFRTLTQGLPSTTTAHEITKLLHTSQSEVMHNKAPYSLTCTTQDNMEAHQVDIAPSPNYLSLTSSP